jgi:hypothetical protein
MPEREGQVRRQYLNFADYNLMVDVEKAADCHE